MSKTSQRLNQAFYEGKSDGRKGKPFKWANHPQYKKYHAGYEIGKRERLLKNIGKAIK